MGIDLVRRLTADALFETRLREALNSQLDRLPDYELATVQDLLKSKPKPATPGRNAAAKTTLRCTVPTGMVRCAAKDGKVNCK